MLADSNNFRVESREHGEASRWAGPPPLQLYLHYFNFRWRCWVKRASDLHGLIDEAADLGFSGINIGVKNRPHLFL